MKADIIADKLAAKKKLLARRARTKLLKEQSRKQQGQIKDRMTKAERKYMELYGVNPNTLKKTDNRAAIKDKVTVKKTDASNTALKNKKIKEKLDNRKDAIQMLAEKQANKNKNITKIKAGDKDTSKKTTKSSKDDYKKYSSIAAAKAAGSLYYMKNGKKMAAVFAEDLKGLTGSPREKLRKYLNARTKKMSMGGSLKAVPSANTGLKKLPTPVRNKMGYMNRGGTPKKANKGMLIITIGSAKKMKKKNKK
jgi:hypothetical protein